ncbi:condensation domain-containing protein [Streptomyces sp. NPDC059452]|uniref:condensation domain-containing protein n=1 Tax=Streptomyces sp. NPDC059452 TaxID=3346835 RepID=UPI0036A32D50
MAARLALSSAQTGVWMAQQLDPDDRAFNIGEYCDIAGPVDPVLFEQALREVVAATPALRARFDIGEEGLCQYIDDTVDVPLHHIDVSGEPDPRAAAERWMRQDLAKEYDIAKGPLVTWALFTVGAERTLWYRAAHHIVVDGFGLALIASHVADVYTALVTGRPRKPRPPGTLEQVVAADVAYRESERYAHDRQFWLDRLAGQTETAGLTDWRPTRGRASIRESGHLSPTDVGLLRAAARRLDVTWPEIVIAALAVLLHRATGIRELVLGLPVTARTEPMLRRVPGMVTNVVPLRLSLSPETDFAAVVTQTSQRLEEALRHQHYPQEDLVRELPGLPNGRRQFGPDINIMSFNYQGDYAGRSSAVHTLCSGPVEDLTVNVYDRMDGQGLQIALDGNAELYTPAQLADHIHHFVSLLRSVPSLLDGCEVSST